jgi:endonuclease-3
MDRGTRLLQKKALLVAERLERFLGIPRQSKRKAKPLDMLIATVLSQNTNDQNSHRAYVNLRKTFSTWQALLDAPLRKIVSAIRVGGMANQKSVRIKRLLHTLKRRYGTLNLAFLKKKSNDEVFEILLSLDGVGTKTAACVLLFSMGRDVFPVDTHVHRICGRLGLTSDCKTPEKTFERMKEIVPEGKGYSFHTNLIRFGRKVCRSTHPLCGVCPLYVECRYEQKKTFKGSIHALWSQSKIDFMLLDNV